MPASDFVNIVLIVVGIVETSVLERFVAGKIEFDAFDNSFKKQMINPKDPSVNPLEMGEQLLNGYQEFLKALSLDSVPNANALAPASRLFPA